VGLQEITLFCLRFSWEKELEWGNNKYCSGRTICPYTVGECLVKRSEANTLYIRVKQNDCWTKRHRECLP
jgi:hypothetical protein